MVSNTNGSSSHEQFKTLTVGGLFFKPIFKKTSFTLLIKQKPHDQRMLVPRLMEGPLFREICSRNFHLTDNAGTKYATAYKHRIVAIEL